MMPMSLRYLFKRVEAAGALPQNIGPFVVLGRYGNTRTRRLRPGGCARGRVALSAVFDEEFGKETSVCLVDERARSFAGAAG
jgi:hypothetical protein